MKITIRDIHWAMGLAILILSAAFGWYEIRPMNIRKTCLSNLKNLESDSNPLEINASYNACLIKSGLSPELLIN